MIFSFWMRASDIKWQNGNIRISYTPIERALAVLRKAGIKKSIVVVRTRFRRTSIVAGTQNQDKPLGWRKAF